MRFFAKSASAAVLAIGIASFVTACSKDDGPDAFVKATIKAVDGEPQAIWKALPESYQKDVQGLVADFGGRMNEQVWNDGIRLGQKAAKVLETKRDFVLGHPQVKGLVPTEEVAKGWDPAVRSISAILNSDLQTLEGVKKLDVEKFLAGPVASILEDVLKAADVAAASMPGKKDTPKAGELRAQLRAAKVTVKQVEGDKATIEVEMPGEKPETQEMVKVEGKWIPKELADAWPAAIAKAKGTLAEVKVDPAMVIQFNAMKGMVEPVLDGLLAAKTQDEFNTQIDNVMKAFMGPGALARAEPAVQTEADAIGDPLAEEAKPVAKTSKKGKKKKARNAR